MTTIYRFALVLGVLAAGGCSGPPASPIAPTLPTFAATAIQLQADHPTVLTVRSRMRILAFIRGTNGGPLSGARVAFSATAGASVTPAEALSSQDGIIEVLLEADRDTTITASAVDQPTVTGSLTLRAVVPTNIAVGGDRVPQLTVGEVMTFYVGVEDLDMRARTTSVRIEFGDSNAQTLGSSAGSFGPSHAYRQPGTYRVTAIATIVVEGRQTQIGSVPFVVTVR